MSPSPGTLTLLAGELAQLFDPLGRRVEDGSADSVLEWLGLERPDAIAGATTLLAALTTSVSSAAALPAFIAALADAFERDDQQQAAAAGLSLLEHIAVLIGAGRDVASELQSLSATASGLTPSQRADLAAFAATFVDRLLHRLMVEYIEDRFPQLALPLVAAGTIEVVDEAGGPPGSILSPHVRKTFHFDRLAKLFTDPAGLLEQVYKWGQPDFDGVALFNVLRRLLETRFGIPAQVLQPPGGPAALEAFVFSAEVNPGISPPGVDLSLRAPAAFSGSQTIDAGDWQVAITTRAEFAADLTATVRPVLDVEVDAAAGTVDVGLAMDAARRPASAPFLLLGEAEGSRLEVQSLGAGAQVDVHLDPTRNRIAIDPELRGSLRGGKIVISGRGADSFIGALLSGGEIESNFDVGVTWSPSGGAAFVGSAALEIAVPAHVSVGPLEVQAIYLRAALADDGSIPIELSGGFSAGLGPLTASVDRLGLTATLAFPSGGGNLGPANLAFAFKPPNGVGLAIDAGPVKGGGYLYIDPEKGEYAGLLELTVADFLSLKAIGLINTRMPGGESGFALLIIITAEFNPGFQLGFGFTLIGVGGLLGLNRAVLLDPLVEGVRTGAVNSILFPTNVIENAPRILSDLRAIFPPQRGTFLIGPMAKIGWGTPTLISISLGVVIEIPGNVVILGLLRAALPTADEPVLVLQVSFLGVLELDRRRVWFFATLFESRVLFITLEGEMGLLMDFSDQPNFVLPVGGFHPRFAAPPLPFPTPARLSLTLINESWARVRVDAYFAVTSNTVQFGCLVDAFFGFDAFRIQGDFSFDALLRFSPFYLIVDISAGFSVKVFGVGVFSVHLKGSLEGPTPWRIRGEAEISILFFSFSVDVDVTFGERRVDVLPPIAVLPRIRAELEKLESWRATLPPSGQLFVSLRDLGSAGVLVLHPIGTLQISQRFAPLNLQLDKIGNQKPSDVKRVAVSVQAGALAVKGPTREPFAAAQYRDMDDAAKLSAPSFEPLESGVELGAAGLAWATGPAAQRNVRYETIIVDTAFERFRIRFFKFWDGLFSHFRAGGAVSRATVSLAYERRMKPFTSTIVIREEQYTVAWQSTNAVYATGASFGSHAEARAHLEDVVRRNPALADSIHVIPAAEASRAA